MATMAVNNGVNVQALLDAREALKGAPEAAKFTWRASCKWQNGTHSESKVEGLLRPRPGAAAQDRDVVLGRSPRDLRVRGQGHHADRVRARRAGQLPDRRRRRRRPEPRHPAALGRVEARRQDGHPRHPRHRQRRPQRLRRHQGHLQDRRRRVEEGDRGDRRAVAEALGGLRRDHQPGRTSPSKWRKDVPSSASPRSSSGPAMPASPRAGSSPTGRSTTSCSSAARWRTPGAASAGTRCACSRPTGRAVCRATPTTARIPTAT